VVLELQGELVDTILVPEHQNPKIGAVRLCPLGRR
jgi:hypothetical protein